MDNLKRTPAHFSSTEVIANFQALYETLDFKSELNGLGISALHIPRRRKVIREFKAIAVAFWGLALTKSFPDDAERFFSRYMETTPEISNNSRSSNQMREKIYNYATLLKEKKDADFMPIASYFTENLDLNFEDVAKFRLKVSLRMRTLYTLIFDRLV